MGIIKKLSGAIFCLILGAGMLTAAPELPKVTIMGKTFYIYETERNESIEDIAKRFGWDEQIIRKTNSEISYLAPKGSMIYYPATAKKSSSASNPGAQSTAGDLYHTVKAGETAYGIARSYNLPVDSLYALNPSAEKGVRKGEQLLIKRQSVMVRTADENAAQSNSSHESLPLESNVEENTPMLSSTDYIYHTVENGESLYGIANRYSTTIDELFRSNPGLTAGNPHEGEIIRISQNAPAPEIKKEMVEEKQLDSLGQYRVKRGDSWESIAEANNLTVDILKQANPGKVKIEKGEILQIPVLKTVNVMKEYVAEDPRMKNAEGVKEIYNEIHSLPAAEAISEIPSVGVAIVLSEAPATEEGKRMNTNKNMEFSRGALTALDVLKGRPFKTRLTIIDGALPTDSVTMLLNEFTPNLIVSTSDTQIPECLFDYATDHSSTMLLSAFDTRGEGYIDNPNIIQYLAPSSYMQSEVADYFNSAYSDYKLLIAGTPDENDLIGNAIIRSFAEGGRDKAEEISVEELEELNLDDNGKYLIYCSCQNEKDVKGILEKINNLKLRHLNADVRVIGRPSWVTMTSLKDDFGRAYVNIPTRFYFDPEDFATKDFIDRYYSYFNLRPMKAAPSYCATAYDIMTYFVPNLAANGGDFNQGFESYPTLQIPMSLERVSNWGGMVNKGVYIVNFTPLGIVDRVTLPQSSDSNAADGPL